LDANWPLELIEPVMYRGRWSPRLEIGDYDPWARAEIDGYRPQREPAGRQLLGEALRRARLGEVAPFVARQYWSHRQDPTVGDELLDAAGVWDGFLNLLRQLDHAGYLDLAAGPACCDAGSIVQLRAPEP
jgi:hypothetical protein